MGAAGDDAGDRTAARPAWSTRRTYLALGASAVLVALASAVISRTVADHRRPSPTASTEAIATVYPAARRAEFLALCHGTGTSAPRCGCMLNEFQRTLPIDGLGPIEDTIRARAPLTAEAQGVLAACIAKVG